MNSKNQTFQGTFCVKVSSNLIDPERFSVTGCAILQSRGLHQLSVRKSSPIRAPSLQTNFLVSPTVT